VPIKFLCWCCISTRRESDDERETRELRHLACIFRINRTSKGRPSQNSASSLPLHHRNAWRFRIRGLPFMGTMIPSLAVLSIAFLAMATKKAADATLYHLSPKGFWKKFRQSPPGFHTVECSVVYRRRLFSQPRHFLWPANRNTQQEPTACLSARKVFHSSH